MAAAEDLSRSKIVNRSWWRLVATNLSASRPGRAGVAGTVAAARVACASVCPAAVPCRGVLSLKVYRAVVLVPIPVHRGLAYTAVTYGASTGLLPVSPELSVEPSCPKNSLRLGTILRAGYCCCVRADQIRHFPVLFPGQPHRVALQERHPRSLIVKPQSSRWPPHVAARLLPRRRGCGF